MAENQKKVKTLAEEKVTTIDAGPEKRPKLGRAAFQRRVAHLKNRFPHRDQEWLEALAALQEERAKIEKKRITDGFRLAESKGKDLFTAFWGGGRILYTVP